MNRYSVKQIATADEAYYQEAGDFYLVYKRKFVGKFADSALAEKVRDLLNASK